jgi:hypothetical protein
MGYPSGDTPLMEVNLRRAQARLLPGAYSGNEYDVRFV